MPKKKLGFWAVWSIGVGGMVGGIFPVLGLAVQLTHESASIAFAIAGIVALITTRSYVQLSLAYPCQGGTVTFLNRAFGSGIFTGSLNLLLWFSYVVMLSLYFSGFGSYIISLFTDKVQPLWKHSLISIAILGITGLNLLSSHRVGQAQRWIVGFKLAILLGFVGMGMGRINLHSLVPVIQLPPQALIAGAMVIFLSYEGFELIANTAEDVASPEETLPRAYYSAVLFTVLLYILVTMVTVSILPIAQIVAARDYALAKAAIPLMGSIGSGGVVIAALLSTLSASNATFYAAARFSFKIVQSRGLAMGGQKDLLTRSSIGLWITSGITLLLANLFDLSRIATIGSAGFLLVFTAINLATARLSRHLHSQQWISLLGAGICLSALALLVERTRQTDPLTLWFLVVLVGLVLGVEGVYAWRTKYSCSDPQP